MTIRIAGSPSADPNTLDWYEEGVWTPTLSCDTPGTLAVAYTAQAGIFTRIGRMVHLAFALTINTITVGTGSGGIRVTGLPYGAANLGVWQYGPVYPINIDLGGTPATFICGIAPNETHLYLRGPQNNAGALAPVIGGVSAGDQLLGTIVYATG
jgi:hypothetical protein